MTALFMDYEYDNRIWYTSSFPIFGYHIVSKVCVQITLSKLYISSEVTRYTLYMYNMSLMNFLALLSVVFYMNVFYGIYAIVNQEHTYIQ